MAKQTSTRGRSGVEHGGVGEKGSSGSGSASGQKLNIRPHPGGFIVVTGGVYTPPGPFAVTVLVTGGVDASNNALFSATLLKETVNPYFGVKVNLAGATM